MKVLHSVRTRIIVISLALLLLFMIAYTVTIWTLADSYALMNTSQNNAFSLSLVSQEISGNLDDVRALVTRVAIDNELKSVLAYQDADSLDDYYDPFENMIKANPAYSVIDRFIVTDRTCSHFLQTGGAQLSSGRPLRQDYFLEEISHVDDESGFSGLFFSDLAYRDYQVIGYLRPIIDYNTGLTIGYVYASVSIDALLRPLYSYQELNDAEVYVAFRDRNYMVSGSQLQNVTDRPVPGDGETVFSNETTRVARLDDGRYMLSTAEDDNRLSLDLVFAAPSLLGTQGASPAMVLAIAIGVVVLLIATILSVYLNKAIYRPVRRLADRIGRIQHSDFSQDGSIDTPDEFGIIGRGINSLSGEVTALMDRRVEDERRKLELEYRMLQSQINPHFLYNTFNSIKWMATIQGADGIGEMITSLSRLMKNISKREASLVPLSEELGFIDDYLVIMKYRYGNTISYYRNVDDGAKDVMIPRFTLQPLVENAIFHGIEPRGTGAIAIIAKSFADHVTIMVADNGVGFEPGGEKSKGDGVFKNIGLDNIRQRLEYTYAQSVSFDIRSTPGLGTSCIIRLDRMQEEGR